LKTVLVLNLLAVAAYAALIGLTYGPPREIFIGSPLYVGGIIGIVVLLFPAIAGHRDTRMEGTHATLGWRDLFRSAPVWAWVLCGIAIISLVVFSYQIPEVANRGSTSFSLNRAGLEGRPDRWRMCLSFFMMFHAIGSAIAISAIRRRDAWMNVP
jgi:hypothetical protein